MIQSVVALVLVMNAGASCIHVVYDDPFLSGVMALEKSPTGNCNLLEYWLFGRTLQSADFRGLRLGLPRAAHAVVNRLHKLWVREASVSSAPRNDEQRAPKVARKQVPTAARIVTVVVCVLLGWHFLATYTWNAAPNAIRAAIGQETLQAWMIPMFGQSWAVFAPNPGSVNQSLEVRAVIDGEEMTEWYSLTDRSTREDVRLHPIPSRMYLNDYILANRYYDSAQAIPVEVRNLAGEEFVGEEWWNLLENRMLEASGARADKHVSSFVLYERTVLGLAAEAAVARWGGDVSMVQVRVVKTSVVPFAQRGTDFQPKVTSFTDGWRSPLRVDGIDAGVFTDMFEEKGTR